MNDNPVQPQSMGIQSIAISLDGLMLAAGSCSEFMGIYCTKEKATLWDMLTHQQLGTPFTELPCQVTSVAFSPDGRSLASGGCGTTLAVSIFRGRGDQFVALRDVDLNNWKQLACWISGRNFTQAEWTQYFPNEPYRIICPQWPAGE